MMKFGKKIWFGLMLIASFCGAQDDSVRPLTDLMVSRLRARAGERMVVTTELVEVETGRLDRLSEGGRQEHRRHLFHG